MEKPHDHGRSHRREQGPPDDDGGRGQADQSPQDRRAGEEDDEQVELKEGAQRDRGSEIRDGRSKSSDSSPLTIYHSLSSHFTGDQIVQGLAGADDL